jgi:segregation and condensation protein B
MSELPDLPTSLPLEAALEALLFAAPGPVSPTQLATTLGQTVEQIEQGLKSLESIYQRDRGLRLQRHAGRVQLTTAPELAALVEKLLGLESTSRLSRAALETLSVIAYQQPITRPQLDDIRGVNSDGVLRSLLSKGMVQEMGRAETPGRPVLFGITADFLQHFGLSSVEDLPSLDLEAHAAQQEVPSQQILKD